MMLSIFITKDNYLNYMEKSSEKLIRNVSPPRNAFKDMLSEVKLRLPSPNDNKKKKHQRNYVLDIDPFVDRNSSKDVDEVEPGRDKTPSFSRSSKSKQKEKLIAAMNVPMPTKNSSDTGREMKSRSQLISEWIIEYMERKSLLGDHWQIRFKERKRQLLQQSFKALKQFSTDENYTFNNFQQLEPSKKVEILGDLVKRCQLLRVKKTFDRLYQFSKDEGLFRLSNTFGQSKDKDKDNSLLLKLESEYKYGSKDSNKNKKEVNISQRDISIGSYDMPKSKKASECGTPSQDLSALILNHNKLHLSGELNHSLPNIPKSNKQATIKNIETHKDIGELSMQTKKKINSMQKLSDNDELPLQSNRNVIRKQSNPNRVKHESSLFNHLDSLKEENNHHNINETNPNIANNPNKPTNLSNSITPSANANSPVTITYILKHMDINNILPQQIPSNQNPNTEHNIQAEQSKNYNVIHKLPLLEPISQPPSRNVFNDGDKPKQGQGQRRRISLEIKSLPGLYISPDRTRYSFKPPPLKTNQYYPEESAGIENKFKMLKQSFPFGESKPRPRSAAPKITFTFSSSPVSSNAQSNVYQNAKQSQCLNQNKLKTYDERDCIIENSNVYAKQQVPKRQNQIRNNRFTVVSPSHMKESKYQQQPVKLRPDHREHIKEKLLPAAYDEYYANEDYQHHPNQNKAQFLYNSNSSKSPFPVQKVSFKEVEQINTKEFPQGSTANASAYGQYGENIIRIGWQNKANVIRTKSPKEKISVTFLPKTKN